MSFNLHHKAKFSNFLTFVALRQFNGIVITQKRNKTSWLKMNNWLTDRIPKIFFKNRLRVFLSHANHPSSEVTTLHCNPISIPIGILLKEKNFSVGWEKSRWFWLYKVLKWMQKDSLVNEVNGYWLHSCSLQLNFVH